MPARAHWHNARGSERHNIVVVHGRRGWRCCVRRCMHVLRRVVRLHCWLLLLLCLLGGLWVLHVLLRGRTVTGRVCCRVRAVCVCVRSAAFVQAVGLHQPIPLEQHAQLPARLLPQLRRARAEDDD